MALVPLSDWDTIVVVLNTGEIRFPLDRDGLGHWVRHRHRAIRYHCVHPLRQRGHGLWHHCRGRRHRVHRTHNWGGGLALRESRLLGAERGGVGLLRLSQLLIERLRRVVLKRQSRFADSNGGGFLAHLLTLKIAFQRVKKQTVVWDTVPVKDLLLLLCSDAVVLVEKVEEGALWLLQRSVGSRLEISQVGEDALLKLLGVFDRTAKSLESERQASHDICTRNVKKIVPAVKLVVKLVIDTVSLILPENARDIFASWQQESANVLIGLPVDRS